VTPPDDRLEDRQRSWTSGQLRNERHPYLLPPQADSSAPPPYHGHRAEASAGPTLRSTGPVGPDAPLRRPLCRGSQAEAILTLPRSPGSCCCCVSSPVPPTAYEEAATSKTRNNLAPVPPTGRRSAIPFLARAERTAEPPPAGTWSDSARLSPPPAVAVGGPCMQIRPPPPWCVLRSARASL